MTEIVSWRSRFCGLMVLAVPVAAGDGTVTINGLVWLRIPPAAWDP
jgi:hypothetical protein